ncbi:MAG: hypothetical protein AAFO58_04250 [Pseudomonadota bacterium]
MQNPESFAGATRSEFEIVADGFNAQIKMLNRQLAGLVADITKEYFPAIKQGIQFIRDALANDTIEGGLVSAGVAIVGVLTLIGPALFGITVALKAAGAFFTFAAGSAVAFSVAIGAVMVALGGLAYLADYFSNGAISDFIFGSGGPDKLHADLTSTGNLLDRMFGLTPDHPLHSSNDPLFGSGGLFGGDAGHEQSPALLPRRDNTGPQPTDDAEQSEPRRNGKAFLEETRKAFGELKDAVKDVAAALPDAPGDISGARQEYDRHEARAQQQLAHLQAGRDATPVSGFYGPPISPQQFQELKAGLAKAEQERAALSASFQSAADVAIRAFQSGDHEKGVAGRQVADQQYSALQERSQRIQELQHQIDITGKVDAEVHGSADVSTKVDVSVRFDNAHQLGPRVTNASGGAARTTMPLATGKSMADTAKQ